MIHHSIRDMVGQRVMQIACGYEDADDCDTLRNDSMLKMSCGRMADGRDLCSQPTMMRLENHLGHRELYEIGESFIDNFIKSYGNDIPAKIILDLDDSNSNVYGAQQLSLFNQYCGEYCYMPLFIFEGVQRADDSSDTPPGAHKQAAQRLRHHPPSCGAYQSQMAERSDNNTW